MKRKIFSILIISASIISLTFNSCKKDTPDTETQSTVDNGICEGEFYSRLGIINNYANNQSGIKSAGPTITTDTTHPNARILTIDFGTGTLDSIDGKVRKGQIVVKFDSLWHKTGTVAIAKFVNYFVANSATAEFLQFSADSIVITRTSGNTFSYNVINGKCSGSFYLEWSGSRNVTQTAGSDTQTDYTDDVFSATGSSNGKDRNGKTYSVNITSPVVKRTTCHWMESGRMDLTPAGLSARTIDYGDGTCDSKATLTINGNVYTFNLN